LTTPKEVAPGWPYPILIALAEELGHASKLMKTPGVDPDFARRVMLRTLFSTLDAYAFVLSDRALAVAASSGITFSKSTLEVLREAREKEMPDGKVELVPQFNATSTHLRKAIFAFAKAYGVKSPLPTGDVPSELKRVEDARHRLTHPRKVSHLRITPAEVLDVAAVGKWFMEIGTWANAEEQRYIERLRAKAHEDTERMIEELRSNAPEPKES
jgi:hypothetical protein